MNSPKLTNILLIALVVLNIIVFAGVHMAHHHHKNFQGYGFRGREHGSFGNFHRGFEAYRGDYGGFHGGFRNHYRHQGGCNCCNM
jgi:hypothetical protein